MAKNNFRVTSSSRFIIRIGMKNFLSQRCLFIFRIFYLNEKQLNQQVCLIKCVENEISNSSSHKKKKKKKKKREREEQKIKPISKTFLRLLKNFD